MDNGAGDSAELVTAAFVSIELISKKSSLGSGLWEPSLLLVNLKGLLGLVPSVKMMVQVVMQKVELVMFECFEVAGCR